MTGYCEYPLCDRIEERSGFCFLHAKHFAGPKPKKEPVKISQVSEKRKVVNREYKKIVKEKLKADDCCKMKSPVCTGKAQGLDHLQKRSPKNLTDKNNCLPCCNACNLYKETHPEWAKNNGFAISRFLSNQKTKTI